MMSAREDKENMIRAVTNANDRHETKEQNLIRLLSAAASKKSETEWRGSEDSFEEQCSYVSETVKEDSSE